MCGIIGYIGQKNASQILHEALKKLTYRGYDSWGLAIHTGSDIFHVKNVGDIEKLEKVEIPFESNIGIAHTRWATAGPVTKENAHPHFNEDKSIAVVHNGIIENFQELKKELEMKGHQFSSETDTEVTSHLIEEYIEEGNDFPEAVRKAFLRLEGRNAIVVMHKEFPGLVAVKKGSPLVIGVGNSEYFVASDIRAFLNHTKRVIFLDDNEMVILNGNENR